MIKINKLFANNLFAKKVDQKCNMLYIPFLMKLFRKKFLNQKCSKLYVTYRSFNIKESDSIQQINKKQRELKVTIDKLQILYTEIEAFKAEKAFKDAFNE